MFLVQLADHVVQEVGARHHMIVQFFVVVVVIAEDYLLKDIKVLYHVVVVVEVDLQVDNPEFDYLQDKRNASKEVLEW